MTLKEKIKKDQVFAMKSGDQNCRITLGGLMSVVKNREIEKRAELEEEEILEAIMSEVKKRKDSINQFRNGGRNDLAEKEELEMKILMAYLPQQMTEDELGRVVKDTISQLGAESPRDMGKVIGVVMSKIKGRADGSVVSRLVKELLISD